MRRQVIVTLRLSSGELEFLRRGASEMMKQTGQKWDTTAMLRRGGLLAADMAVEGFGTVVAEAGSLRAAGGAR